MLSNMFFAGYRFSEKLLKIGWIIKALDAIPGLTACVLRFEMGTSL